LLFLCMILPVDLSAILWLAKKNPSTVVDG